MCQPHKMVKHTQTIHRQQPTNCLSVSVHFVGFALKGLKKNFFWYRFVYVVIISSSLFRTNFKWSDSEQVHVTIKSIFRDWKEGEVNPMRPGLFMHNLAQAVSTLRQVYKTISYFLKTLYICLWTF